jgi:hypothetical protein
MKFLGGADLNVYLAGGESRVNMYLAGCDPAPIEQQESIRKKLKPMILESFLQVNKETVKFLPYYESYMLDSGAFSMLMGNAGQKDLRQYVDAFADYITTYKVDKYFELDIDPFIGYPEVKRIRDYLYKKTGVQPIPVWHKSRGIDDFKQMCKDYPYVAIGGYVSKEFSKTDIQHFPKLIRYAHQQGAKIHGLGFTALKWLPICHFDSVDSTAWVSGNRFGYVYKFDGKTMIKIDRPPGKRVDYKKVAINNFVEWVKFQRYAETHF